MTKKCQSFPGMEDLFPGEIEKWQWVEKKSRDFFSVLSFGEIRTPVLEPTELFSRSIGETSDIVHKEMYSFEDRGGRGMTLRPEMTASVARAVIEKGLIRGSNVLRFFYIGPMFRAERPQAGRKRQFHQIGAEIINEKKTQTDVQIIKMVHDFLKYVGVEGLRIRLNDLSLMSGETGVAIRNKLRSYFEGHKSSLDKDSLYRLDKNVLRIFDSKDEKMQPIIEACPWDEIAPLSDDFREVCALLEAEEIGFEINRRLVRGLDYYTGVVFEVGAPGLGAQDAVAGGGRYDELYKELGGPEAPCTGFSLGIERLLMALEASSQGLQEKIRGEDSFFFAALELSSKDQNVVTSTALLLQELGCFSQVGDFSSSLNNHLKRANKLGMKHMLIRGPEEVKQNAWILKNMNERSEKIVTDKELINLILERKKTL